jgi:hypothetical protein
LLPNASAQDRSLVQLFPESTVAFVEIAPADQWIQHPLRQQVQASANFKEVWRSEPVMKLRSGLMLAEFALGDKAENLITKLTMGGAALAVDKEQQGVALVAKTESKDWLESYLKKIVKLARDEAAKKGGDDPLKETEYRGLLAYKTKDGIIAALDEYLLVTNKHTLAKIIADRYVDRSADGFEQTEQYSQFAKDRNQATDSSTTGKEVGWMTVDIQSLRKAGVAPDLLGGRAKDFGAEMILGGLLAVLHQTPTVSGTLRLSDSKISLSLDSPYQTDWGGEERVFFFGEEGKGQAMPLLQSENRIASLSAYRDVSQMWLRAGDLFDATVNDQLAQADSTLTTLFSGRDFGEEILGAIYPEVRIVVSHQDFKEASNMPAVKLPEFALVAKLRNPALMKQELKRIFQSLVGFINVTSAMNGQPQLDLDIEGDSAQQYYTARFVREVDRKDNAELPVQFNFSPCLAFVDDFVVLSSTVALTKQLAVQLKSGTEEIASPVQATAKNTILNVQASALREALEANRKLMVSQNMVENGHSKSEAETEVGLLLAVLKMLDQMNVDLSFDNKATLETSLHFVK